MELRHLRYFVALAEELHFTRAAKRLGISQPPLSQQIRALEDELDTPLFERTRRRVALTEAGRMLLEEARATLAQAARAETVARRAGRGEIGELRVGLFASVPVLPVFQRTIIAFRQRLPSVTLTLEESPTRQQIEALRRRQLDAGFLRLPSAEALPADIAALEVAREELVVVMREDHPLAKRRGRLPVRALEGEPLIGFAPAIGTTLNDQLAALCNRAGFTPRIAQEARENSTLMGLVAAGLGIAVVPETLTRIQVGDVIRRRLDSPDATTATWLATPREHMTALAKVFLECVG
ncbi:LysR substrate-binding domain-containing protein [Rhodovarius lipocyclicus]|uniref:LysR substrate-binding domain-containing protein n=1 Tax=Rhodovarius lipocyclicus TaxID=268410 RepID=UPI00135C8450|nr:LysR substrate-binding domain-containing protein [Rhodovarius lipocyclicus]